MRVKDIIPYITNNIIVVTHDKEELSRIYNFNGYYEDFPKNSKHEIIDSIVLSITAEIAGIRIEVE